MRNEGFSKLKVARAEANLRLTFAIASAAALGLVGFLVAGTNAQGAVHQGASGATVSLRTTKLGVVLVNSKGRTLYMFAKDKSGKSSCTATCAKYWPPALAQAKPTAGTGIKTALLGTTKRADGRKQVTYNHHPLYGFALDKQAGQTNGQGESAFGSRWWAVSATGKPVTKTVTTTTGTTTTTETGTTTPETTTTTTRYP
jgi:predicted lipoprotein with Yx(FWY)xxD motif